MGERGKRERGGERKEGEREEERKCMSCGLGWVLMFVYARYIWLCLMLCVLCIHINVYTYPQHSHLNKDITNSL